MGSAHKGGGAERNGSKTEAMPGGEKEARGRHRRVREEKTRRKRNDGPNRLTRSGETGGQMPTTVEGREGRGGGAGGQRQRAKKRSGGEGQEAPTADGTPFGGIFPRRPI